jgi:hypothetical protein
VLRGSRQQRPSGRRGSRLALAVLLAAAVLSVALMGSLPGEGMQLPLAAVLAALLPLQLAALFYGLRRGSGPAAGQRG